MPRIKAEWVAIALTAVTITVPSVVWAVRLEGRTDAAAVVDATQDKALESLRQQQKESVEQLLEEVRYIRERLDRVLEARGR